ncbi:NAD(P)/FAD-dependent oxidoreductase [Ferrovibrio sp.]|uniref:NAD(P)/FAD-dependent oxidoreductase n=1 Tax=Ferrovibrio sp. TaxID=1917215 RepID=UPI003D142E69
MTAYDAIILGAGGAGLMCAAVAGQRGLSVLVLDHAPNPGEKIRISGGGRCNFTNLHATPANFLSANPRFCVSALSRYSPSDFVALVESHGIAWHEKTLGQLFCDGSAKQIVQLLLDECAKGQAEICMAETITAVTRDEAGFQVTTDKGGYRAAQLVVATGGLSIPKIGATDFGYRLARQFGLGIVPTRPGLVPLTFAPDLLAQLAPLAGLAVPQIEAQAGKGRFREALLFTHRGLSGPAILQVSSYWHEGEAITLNLAPDTDVFAALKAARGANPRQELATALGQWLPKRLAQQLSGEDAARRLADLNDARLRTIADLVRHWRLMPVGSEGYRTAEVTLGGVDTADLSSQTLAAKAVPGLHFIGEVVDVTGHLGGFNFQWAWASAQAAGKALFKP